MLFTAILRLLNQLELRILTETQNIYGDRI